LGEEANRPARWFVPMAALALIAAVGVLLARGPIPQDPSYHAFADHRTLLGVPNLLNVLSNLPFMVFGIAGLTVVRGERSTGLLRELRPAYTCFFAGSACVAIGSAIYHLDPNNLSLVWDRLPMTIAFMSFFAIVIGEHVGPEAGRRLLPPLLMVGPASVLYWWFTEARSAGDLRFYGLVQFLPLVLIPLILGLYRSLLTRVHLVWLVLVTYAIAKLFELYDAPIYARIGVSGHTLKHLAASAGVLLFLVAVRTRTVREDSGRLRAVTRASARSLRRRARR